MTENKVQQFSFFAAVNARFSHRIGDALLNRVGDTGTETDHNAWKFNNPTWFDLHALFLQYCSRTYRFTNALSSLLDEGSLRAKCKGWLLDLKPVYDVRGMADHLDDYIRGEGQKQAAFVKSGDFGDWTADGSTLTFNNNDVILGQHVSVNSLMPIFKDIYDQLSE